MALLLSEIAWSAPLLPPVPDAQWEAEVKRRAGTVSEAQRRLVPCPWLREALLEIESYRPALLTPRLVQIGSVVTAQENACRYCYGATRAYLRMMGYPESLIGRIEREAQLAELEEKDRAFIQFCRSLARSRPRPARAEHDALVRLGYSPQEVAEMAFFIVSCCFYNRVATLMACPPEAAFERFVASPLGRVVGLLGPVVRAVHGIRVRSGHDAVEPLTVGPDVPFAGLILTLQGLPAAAVMQRALEGALASTLLTVRCKSLMFAVVARALDCGYCASHAGRFAIADGFSAQEVDRALAELDSPRLEPYESALLAWVRDTVHYEPVTIQQRTRELMAQIGPQRTLEAIGTAALANATVRLAMLLESE